MSASIDVVQPGDLVEGRSVLDNPNLLMLDVAVPQVLTAVICDTTPGNATPHPVILADSSGRRRRLSRIVANLHVEIEADLTVRLHAVLADREATLAELVVPKDAAPDHPVECDPSNFADLEIPDMTPVCFEIVDSDGSVRSEGVCTIMVVLT